MNVGVSWDFELKLSDACYNRYSIHVVHANTTSKNNL